MKNQVAAEFTMYAALAMMIVLTVLVVLGSYYGQKKDERAYYEATNLGRGIQKELIVASQVKPGMIRTLKLPESILGTNYSINTYGDQVSINYKGKTQYFNTPALKGTLKIGDNNITSNETTIIIN